MLHIQTSVGPSKIHGLGVFTKEFVPKGKTVATYKEGFDIRMTREELLALPRDGMETFWQFGWCLYPLDEYAFDGDNLRYINDSKRNANLTIGNDHFATYAKRDIQPNEELSIRYLDFYWTAWNRNALTDIYHAYIHHDPHYETLLKGY